MVAVWTPGMPRAVTVSWNSASRLARISSRRLFRFGLGAGQLRAQSFPFGAQPVCCRADVVGAVPLAQYQLQLLLPGAGGGQALRGVAEGLQARGDARGGARVEVGGQVLDELLAVGDGLGGGGQLPGQGVQLVVHLGELVGELAGLVQVGVTDRGGGDGVGLEADPAAAVGHRAVGERLHAAGADGEFDAGQPFAGVAHAVEPVQVGLDPAALAGVVGLLAGQGGDGGAGIGQGALGLGEQVPEREGVPVGDRVDPLAQHGVLGLGRGLAGGRRGHGLFGLGAAGGVAVAQESQHRLVLGLGGGDLRR